MYKFLKEAQKVIQPSRQCNKQLVFFLKKTKNKTKKSVSTKEDYNRMRRCLFTFIRNFLFIFGPSSKIFKILSMHIMRAYSKEFFIFFIVLELAGISFALNFRNQWSVHLENRIKSSFHNAQKYGKVQFEGIACW